MVLVSIRRFVTALYGGTVDQLTTAVGRLLGFKATSAQLRAEIEAQVERMLQSGELEDTEGGGGRCPRAGWEKLDSSVRGMVVSGAEPPRAVTISCSG